MLLSPKAKRNLIRILPFGLIWLITGSVFVLIITLATGDQNLSRDLTVTMTLPVFVFTRLASTSVGLLIGLIELVVFEKRFRKYNFARKVATKFFIYMVLMLVIIAIAFPITSSIELSTSPLDPEVLKKTASFFQSFLFINTVVQISFQLLLCLLYAAISENLGHQVLLNFFTGRYHNPKEEQRIFMFLDMKNSTTIAEQLGHDQYFKLLEHYYEIMTDPIINSLGEVYQYIGDEVVITWDAHKGLTNNHCILCFERIKQNLKNHGPQFEKTFSLVPDFKAGLHMGKVTTGQIGALKKEVFYTGDVMNTTARVQELCSEYDVDLIVSEDLLDRLEDPNQWPHHFLGELSLKGKSERIKVHAVEVDNKLSDGRK